jgi:hypothetical protein
LDCFVEAVCDRPIRLLAIRQIVIDGQAGNERGAPEFCLEKTHGAQHDG